MSHARGRSRFRRPAPAMDRIEREDMRVIIHCNGGKRRSALVAAAVLIGLGVSQSAAVAGVRAARAGSLRNPLQILFLRSFARRWRKHNTS